MRDQSVRLRLCLLALSACGLLVAAPAHADTSATQWSGYGPGAVPRAAIDAPWRGPPRGHGLDDAALEQTDELTCLALNIYWEARSEPLEGRLAVAAVTLNRVAHEAFPDTVCDVVRQGGEERRHACQFSWWCDGKSDRPENPEAWRAALNLAGEVLAHQHVDPSGNALWFHADGVRPKWSVRKLRTASIGRQVFYREPGRQQAPRSR